jgi:hypothetical protein
MSDGVKRWDIRYRAHNGRGRPAVVLLPARFGPRRPTPALPLVISPHGRNVRAAVNASKWGDLPARGPVVLICPGGMGRKLPLASWGWRGQIADLARMPKSSAKRCHGCESTSSASMRSEGAWAATRHS